MESTWHTSPGDEALHQVERALVAERRIHLVQLVDECAPFDADGARQHARFQNPRRQERASVNSRTLIVVQQVNKIRHQQSGFHRAHAHGELVAEVARGGFAHAGDAQMLANACG